MDSSQDQIEAQKAEATPKLEPETKVVPLPPPAATTEVSGNAIAEKKAETGKDKKNHKPTKKAKNKAKIDDTSASDSSDADSESEDSTSNEKENRIHLCHLRVEIIARDR